MTRVHSPRQIPASVTEVSVAVCSVNHYVGECLWVEYVNAKLSLFFFYSYLINALNLP